MEQLNLFEIQPQDYDHVIVAFSGGKDSLACVLHVLECGVQPDRIELWHHLVDGRYGYIMDWPVTKSYCQAVADALCLPLLFSWKDGGLMREARRQNQSTAPIRWEEPDGSISSKQGRPSPGTRMKFPQVSPDLSVRWCSSYLKIDVAKRIINNSQRFRGKRVLVVTGERAEESTARAGYAGCQVHEADCRKTKRSSSRRHVDHWRPILQWPETQVWEIIQRHGVVPHPAYYAGFGRVSCAFCIFASRSQMATAAHILPGQWGQVRKAEREFGCTMKRGHTLDEWVALGSLYDATTAELAAQLASHQYTMPVRCAPEAWVMPAGAFGDSTGPT